MPPPKPLKSTQLDAETSTTDCKRELWVQECWWWCSEVKLRSICIWWLDGSFKTKPSLLPLFWNSIAKQYIFLAYYILWLDRMIQGILGKPGVGALPNIQFWRNYGATVSWLTQIYCSFFISWHHRNFLAYYPATRRCSHHLELVQVNSESYGGA